MFQEIIHGPSLVDGSPSNKVSFDKVRNEFNWGKACEENGWRSDIPQNHSEFAPLPGEYTVGAKEMRTSQRSVPVEPEDIDFSGNSQNQLLTLEGPWNRSVGPAYVLSGNFTPVVAQFCDYAYIPSRSREKTNLGYAFLNFRSPVIRQRFQEVLENTPISFPGHSNKVIETSLTETDIVSELMATNNTNIRGSYFFDHTDFSTFKAPDVPLACARRLRKNNGNWKGSNK